MKSKIFVPVKEWWEEWWQERNRLIYFAFSLSLSNFYLYIIILDYGLSLSFELGWWLERLNPINYLTRYIPRGIDWLFGRSYVVWQVADHKWVEVQFLESHRIIGFEYRWRAHTDHWGHMLDMSLLGMELIASYYDSRHWKDEEDEQGQL